ncbi:hypothetical protein KEF85_07745 [Methylomonas paludis]|uniref:Putative tail fiber protein gp53-like C-terminal domain-containing protein n=1 Tax=Methylomonas paludis TaxID=1173101 RepID=A0A975MQS4_9GAMM|nr:hypothetical protein [Methylomonas paludis]QWF72328.1 hypothetical protein KEF85_07745 [Methylomonas paludis]
MDVGDIAGAGHWLELQYDSVNDNWVLLNPATGLNNVFVGSNQSLDVNGFQKFPGGLIEQWGVSSDFSGEGAQSIVLPIPFSNKILNVQATVLLYADTVTADEFAQTSGWTPGTPATGFEVYMQRTGGGSFTWPQRIVWRANGF